MIRFTYNIIRQGILTPHPSGGVGGGFPFHPFLVQELRYLEVEARIVDEDDGIRLPLGDVALAEREVSEDGRQMEQDGNEAHVGQIFIMTHARAADFRHQVASEEAELGLWVFLAQRPHQMRGMEVA